MINPEQKLEMAVKALDEKNAHNIVILNMKDVSLVADYFVICHGNSETQVEAIANEVKKNAQQAGDVFKRLEGLEKARWVLVDLEDVVVHVFHQEERSYYGLEKLWSDALQVDPEQIINA